MGIQDFQPCDVGPDLRVVDFNAIISVWHVNLHYRYQWPDFTPPTTIVRFFIDPEIDVIGLLDLSG
jgi:hypothetical protein